MWNQRKPFMGMTLINPRHNKQYLGPSSINTVARQAFQVPSASLAVAPMFSHNMSHLRGAKPCGSCGGR
jgi:hypothetical protein